MGWYPALLAGRAVVPQPVPHLVEAVLALQETHNAEEERLASALAAEQAIAAKLQEISAGLSSQFAYLAPSIAAMQ